MNSSDRYPTTRIVADTVRELYPEQTTESIARALDISVALVDAILDNRVVLMDECK